METPITNAAAQFHPGTEDELYEYAAGLIFHDKLQARDVVDSLMKRGLDEESAKTVIKNLLVEQMEAQQDKEQRSKARKDMIVGAIWCIGGIVVTVATLSNAGNGGSYVVAWGAIIFGGIQFFRGATNW